MRALNISNISSCDANETMQSPVHYTPIGVGMFWGKYEL